MRQRIVLTFAALLSLANAATVSAQAIKQPGQLGASFQLQQGESVSDYSAGTLPKTTLASVTDARRRFVNRLWIASMASAVSGTSFDAASSWGLREGNGILASSNGRFGAKGLSIKARLAAALIGPQIYLRKHQELKRAFIIGNFAEAAFFTGVSIHNLQVRNSQ